MKILLLTNLYPPLHAGTFDVRCQTVTNALRARGHQIRVLTSSHGLLREQRDDEIERRLLLNGVFEHPAVTGFSEMQELETHNHRALREAISGFEPELIYIWSLHGLSKSLLTAIDRSRIPCAFDLSDHWLAHGLRLDPWLRWWNTTAVSMQHKLMRGGLELSERRKRLDAETPTRLRSSADRLPAIFDEPAAPDSITDFHFQRVYFCSEALKRTTVNAGFRLSHAEVIRPGIPVENFLSEAKTGQPKPLKFLVACMLNQDSGVMTALDALRIARERGVNCRLSVHGRGDSDYIAQLRSAVVRFQLPVEFQTANDASRELKLTFRAHDVFIHTSTWDEPYITTPLEAMAAGLPVIASSAGGAGELFLHGQNALVFTPGDAMELAGGMELLANQPDQRMLLADGGQEMVTLKLTQDAMLDRIEHFLRDTIELWQVG